MTGFGSLVVAATFLPWLRSGSTTRTSYDLLGLLARLRVAPDGALALLVKCWPLVPLIVTGAVVLAWSRRSVLASITAVVAVLYAGGVGAALAIGARNTGISIGSGPWVCAVSSLLFLVTMGWFAVTNSSARGR